MRHPRTRVPNAAGGGRGVRGLGAVAAAFVTLSSCALSCSQFAGVADKPCKPGCVDEKTRLECDTKGAPRSVPCAQPAEPCAESMCRAGACTVQPAVGVACGESGKALCNEGYACIGPDVKLTAILEHTCALADDGRVWCWGSNHYAELGDGTTFDRATPVPVHGLPGPAIAVSAGYANTCALMKDGAVYCWGDNTGGQTAPNSETNPVTEPTLVAADVPFVSIAAGQGHACGITPDAAVYCWGNTSAGQCGVDPKDAFAVGPTKIPGLDHVSQIETVKNHICAVRTVDPTLVCWGSNQYLEDGGYIVHKLGPAAATLKYSATPVAVDLGARVVDVGMGFESTYAVTEDGITHAWGYNGRGQIGSTSTDSVVATPVEVMASASTPLRGATDVLRSDGSDQCAVTHDSTGNHYACWGADDRGELGFGVNGFRNYQFAEPTTVLPASAAKMVHGSDHACITANENGGTEIWCYGRAQFTGSGSTEDVPQTEPAPVVWDPKNFERELR
jgi:alpha-tubulin suppressor-like RCC1 family protein